MIEEVVKDYAQYFKLDLHNDLQTVREVIDNMITRLEELTSVLQMIKLKNSDCCNTVTEDISRYRYEVTILSKKIITLAEVVTKLQSNVEILEKRVEKAESDFNVQVDNKLISLLKPFLKKKDVVPNNVSLNPHDKIVLPSILDNFEGNNT